MSFYKNVNAQQDDELYKLAEGMSSSLVGKIFEDCQRRNIVTIAFQTAYYNCDQDHEYLAEPKSISQGLPDELRARNINVKGYDFIEKTSELFTDYIYKKYLDFILDYKKRAKEDKPLCPLIFNIRVDMIGYTQEYIDYEYNMSYQARSILYIKDENGNVSPTWDYDVNACPQVDHFTIDIQGLYFNLDSIEASLNPPARVSASSRFNNDYVQDRAWMS